MIGDSYGDAGSSEKDVVIGIGGIVINSSILAEGDRVIQREGEFLLGDYREVLVCDATDLLEGVAGTGFEAEGSGVVLDEVGSEGDCWGDAVIDIGYGIEEEGSLDSEEEVFREEFVILCRGGDTLCVGLSVVFTVGAVETEEKFVLVGAVIGKDFSGVEEGIGVAVCEGETESGATCPSGIGIASGAGGSREEARTTAGSSGRFDAPERVGEAA